MKAHLKHMLIGGAAILAVLLAVGVDARQALSWAVLLACPLMMVAMMLMMGRGHRAPAEGGHQHNPQAVSEPPDRPAPLATAPVDQRPTGR